MAKDKPVALVTGAASPPFASIMAMTREGLPRCAMGSLLFTDIG